MAPDFLGIKYAWIKFPICAHRILATELPKSLDQFSHYNRLMDNTSWQGTICYKYYGYVGGIEFMVGGLRIRKTEQYIYILQSRNCWARAYYFRDEKSFKLTNTPPFLHEAKNKKNRLIQNNLIVLQSRIVNRSCTVMKRTRADNDE